MCLPQSEARAAVANTMFEYFEGFERSLPMEEFFEILEVTAPELHLHLLGARYSPDAVS